MDMVKDPKPDLSLSAILNAVANQYVQALFSEAAKKAPKITQALSHSAVKVFAQRRDSEGKITAESQATGFYWRADKSLYLITNWHVVTGWNPITDKAISETGFVPTHLASEYFLKEKMGDKLVNRKKCEVCIQLIDRDSSPCWLEHPKFGRKIDVIAVRVCDLAEVELLTVPINTYSDFMDFEVCAGDDAFVIGYPLGLGGGPFPIWKRASVASEPDIDIEGTPKFYIDTATRKGMSGSPVVAIRRGLINPRGATSLVDESVIGTAETFIGIYSGRIDDDLLGAQIGIVWKASVLNEIISGKVIGKSPY
jgi:hypothetical protein